MAYGLADSAANEDDVCNTEDGPPAEVVTQHARNEPTYEGAKGCSRRDEFLSGKDASLTQILAIGREDTYLLPRGQLRWPEITANRDKGSRDNAGVVTCDRCGMWLVRPNYA